MSVYFIAGSWSVLILYHFLLAIMSASGQSDQSFYIVGPIGGPIDIKIEPTELADNANMDVDGEPIPAAQDEVGAQRSAPQEFDIGSLDEGDKMVGRHKTMVVDVDTPQEAPTPPPALRWRRSGSPAGLVLLAPTPSGSPASMKISINT